MTTAYFTHQRCADHDFPNHPEHAGRIRAIWQQLKTARLIDRMEAHTPKPVTDAQILSVHTPQYLQALQLVSHQDGLVRFDSDTYALPESPDIARLAAGGVVDAVDAVLNQDANNALSVVRPPGHHAVPTRAMGFCLLANVSIAAKHALEHHRLDRVMIIDYDVHHGNGTQDIFYDDDMVLFVSTHQYPFYPGSGGRRETGVDRGRGYTLNIPLYAGHGDESYNAIFEQIIWKVAKRYRPQLIIVSAGFDAHWTDPLASMHLSLSGYADITRELIKMADALCDGKIVFALEGGYDLQALSYGIVNVAHALLGDDTIVDPLGKRHGSEPDVQELIDDINRIHHL